MIKSIAIAAAPVAAICGLLALAGDAEAYEYREGRVAGYQAEIMDSGTYDGLDLIDVWGPNGKEEIFVTCAPFDWRSVGPNSVEFADRIARTWCFN